jgi:hypothetical protein
MSANAEATTLEERPRVRPRVRSQVANQSEERRDQDAVAIGSLYRKGREAILDSVRYNLQAGRKLIQKQASMPHGEWVPWLRANADLLGFKHRTTASRLMKAAAVNDASTHHLTEAEAIQINRKLWGNLAAASMPEAVFKKVKAKKRTSLAHRSATEIVDRCIEAARAVVERTITQLRRAHAPRAKFALLFEALGDTIVDVQRQTIDTDDGARRRIRRRDQDSGGQSWR